MEKDAQSREAEILRGAGTAIEGSHGKISRISIQTSAKANLHCRWEKIKDIGV